MKNIISVLILVTSFSVNSQLAKLLPEMKEIPAEDYHLFSYSGDKLIYRFKSPYSAYFENRFKVYNAKTGGDEDVIAEDIIYEGLKGETFSYFIKDDLVYELLTFKTRRPGGAVYNAFAKRDRNTLKQVGEVVLIAEIENPTLGAGAGLGVYESDNGIYVLSVSKYSKDHYIKRYDFDLNEIWSKDLDFLKESGIDVRKISKSDNDDLLFAITITEQPKQTFSLFGSQPVRSSGLMFLHIQSDGESAAVSPEFEESINARNYDFKYYPDKKELVGIFSVTEMIDEKKNETAGLGYAYMKWNIDGGLIKSNKYYLSYEDINSPEMEKFMELSKLKKSVFESEKGLPTIGMGDNFETFFQKDGSVIISHKNFVHIVKGYSDINSSVSKSKLLYKINANGNLVWTKFYPYNSDKTHEYTTVCEKNGKIYLYMGEFAQNIVGNKYQLSVVRGRYGWENSIVTERIINTSTGEEEGFKTILEAPIEDFVIRNMDYTENEIFFGYNNTRKNKMQFAVVKRK